VGVKQDAAVEQAAARESAKKRAVLVKRIGFGLAMAAVAAGLLALDAHTERSFGAASMVALTLFVGMGELQRMLGALGTVPWKGPQRLAALAMVAAQVYQHEMLDGRRFPVDLGDAVVVGFLLVFLGGQLAHKPDKDRLVSILLSTFATAYLLLLGSYFLKVRYLDDLPDLRRTTIGHAGVLYLVAVAKGTDVFAFFTGRFLGTRKMIPWISPGKTWAGGVGGLVGAVAITAGFARWTSLGQVVGWSAVVPVGILMGVIASAGDLVESLVKRATAVKDSGGLVPEFGGVLDIIDCILFAAPTLYLTIALLAR